MLKILLVEDNSGDVLIIKELLKTTDLEFEIKHTASLQNTLELCIENYFDIILLDLGLPDSLGIDTLKKLQAFNVQSPLIVLTGVDDEELALNSLRHGAQDYLVKNRLTSDIIVKSIRYSIERKKIHDLQKLYAHRFSLLSKVTLALNEGTDASSIIKVICSEVSALLEDSNVIAFELISPDKIILSGKNWLMPLSDQIKIITGIDLNQPEISIEPILKNYYVSFFGKKLSAIETRLYGLFNRSVDLNKCEELEKMLNINYVYTIGFIQHKIFYGGYIIFSQNKIQDDDISIIETISNQAALNIHRRSIKRDLRISEEKYKNLSRELEKKVKDRTSDLNNLNYKLNKELKEKIKIENALRISESQLKEINATKDKFFNIVAHDLKNPFTSLLGSSELLFQNIDQIDKKSIKKLAIILNDSAKSGYAILQNLLDWSRSQTGMLKINPEKIYIKDIIEENILNLELFSSNKEIEIIPEIDDLVVYADRNIVNTILRNLLSNAIKFSYRSGKVIVRAYALENEIVISVKDYGIGINKENLNKIFRIDSKFTQPGTEKEQGTGLGLKLSKEFAEKQGGRIWVESKINKGSEFLFSITNNHHPKS